MSDLSPEEQYQLYQEIEARIRKRFDRRKEFFGHFVGYFVTMVGLWFLLLTPTQFGVGLWGSLAALFTIAWSMGVFIHLVQYVFDEWGERAIDSELEKAGVRAIRHSKYKRDRDAQAARLVRLGEDGELVDISQYSNDDDGHFYEESR